MGKAIPEKTGRLQAGKVISERAGGCQAGKAISEMAGRLQRAGESVISSRVSGIKIVRPEQFSVPDYFYFIVVLNMENLINYSAAASVVSASSFYASASAF